MAALIPPGCGDASASLALKYKAVYSVQKQTYATKMHREAEAKPRNNCTNMAQQIRDACGMRVLAT
eukprot:3075-Heterococcus_DN1.PRE.2